MNAIVRNDLVSSLTDTESASRPVISLGDEAECGDWLFRLVTDKSVMEIGCGRGLRALQMALVADFVTIAVDHESDLRALRSVAQANNIRNVKFGLRIDTECLMKADVVTIESCCEQDLSVLHDYVNRVRPETLVITGLDTRPVIRVGLDMGYTHDPSCQEAAVMQSTYC